MPCREVPVSVLCSLQSLNELRTVTTVVDSSFPTERRRCTVASLQILETEVAGSLLSWIWQILKFLSGVAEHFVRNIQCCDASLNSSFLFFVIQICQRRIAACVLVNRALKPRVLVHDTDNNKNTDGFQPNGPKTKGRNFRVTLLVKGSFTEPLLSQLTEHVWKSSWAWHSSHARMICKLTCKYRWVTPNSNKQHQVKIFQFRQTSN